MPSPRFIASALFASGLAVLFSLGAVAEPLDKESCANLKVERKTLLTREMRVALERGPDWVKDHLDSEKIEQVRRFLLVEENLAFRCRGGGVAKPKPTIVPLPDRRPGPPPLPVRAPRAEPTQTIAESENTAPADEAEAGPSQTLADSDKTAPSKTEATTQ